MNIAGKKALVTGGALRLGNALTMMLVSGGAEVAVHYNRSETDAYDLCDMINSDGGTAIPFGKDLSSPEGAQELFRDLDEADFHPQILINSASIWEEERILESQPGSYHRHLDVNALVPMILAREMAKRVDSGAVINLLDSRIGDYDRLHVPYHLSKQALFTFTRILSSELAPAFRVNGIAPGAILPPAEATDGEVKKWTERTSGANPLGTIGTPEQICQAAEFLLTNDFVTGQIIFVDGGRHLHGSFYGL